MLHFACDQDGFWGRCHEAGWCCGVFLPKWRKCYLNWVWSLDVMLDTLTIPSRLHSMGEVYLVWNTKQLHNQHTWNVFLPCTPLLMYTRAIVSLISIHDFPYHVRIPELLCPWSWFVLCTWLPMLYDTSCTIRHFLCYMILHISVGQEVDWHCTWRDAIWQEARAVPLVHPCKLSYITLFCP